MLIRHSSVEVVGTMNRNQFCVIAVNGFQLFGNGERNDKICITVYQQHRFSGEFGGIVIFMLFECIEVIARTDFDAVSVCRAVLIFKIC